MMRNADACQKSVAQLSYALPPCFLSESRQGVPAPLNLVLVTAEPLFRSALCWAMRQIRPDAEVIKVRDLSSASEILRQGPCSLVLLDEASLDINPLQAMRILAAECSARIAILSSNSSHCASRRAFDQGAIGYIARSSSLEDIAATLCTLAERPYPNRPGQKAPLEDAAEAENPLTPAQVKVLALVEKGKLNKQIAHELGIAESTVKAHVSAVLRKLNVQNRVQATLIAHRQLMQPKAFHPKNA